MQIGSGVIINSGALLGASATLSGPVFSYNIGNSMSFSGQGMDLQNGNFNGSPPNEGTNQIFDISADYANGEYGNLGLYLTLGSNSNITGSDYINHGPISYLTFDGGTSSQYVSGDSVNGFDIPSGSSYTIFSVVRVNDFGVGSGGSSGWTGGIVGGNNTQFGFVPPNTAGFVPSNYPSLVASNNNLSSGVVDATTEFQPNTWYAVAVTYDGAMQTMKLYVNGVHTSTGTGILPFSGNEPLFWGTWEGFNWLNGDLAVMSAWSRVLNPSEITSYTTTYGAPYGIASTSQNNDMPTQTYSQLFSEPGIYQWTVPAGVTSISAVTVGAGGGATQSSYSIPGGDTYISTIWNQSSVGLSINQSGSNSNQLIFDCTSGPNSLILGNVAQDWLVTGTQLNNTEANRALIQGNVYAIVTSVDTNDLGNVIVTLNTNIDSFTSGDIFYFQGQGILGAQGGREATTSHYTNSNGESPGPRAIPLLGGIGGMGGVIDPTRSYPIGGAGAGGYGTNDPVIAFDTNQTYVYENDGDENTGIANIVLNLTNNNLSVTATANNSGYLATATGTYGITIGQGVMFSLTVNSNAGVDHQGLGIGNYNANLQIPVGSDANSIGIYNSGNVFNNGTNIGQGSVTFTTNSVVDLAVDNDNRSIWYRVNGGAWNGDANANPSLNTGGFSFSSLTGTNWNPNLYLMTTQGSATDIGQWSINPTSSFTVPSGFTFIAGNANAGSTGGDGSSPSYQTARNGQGIAGSGGGGGGRNYDSGTGGGGIGLYGRGAPGTKGTWKSGNDLNGSGYQTSVALGATGGSSLGNSGTQGGQATVWNGGRGGWPGGGGGSATGYWNAGNGGALAYKNTIAVTPGNTYQIIVGQGGWGGGTGNDNYTNAGVGGGGAVRIVWPGDTRTFPTTNVGIDPAGPSSITIGVTDFTNSSNSGITANIVGGHVVSLTANAGSNIIDRYVSLLGLVNNTLAQDITAMFRQAGMTNINSLTYNGATLDIKSFNAYIFNVTWADNSTGKVRMGWYSETGELLLSVINTTYNNWQVASPSRSSGNPNPVLGGTFSFPATFTPYTPLIESSGDAWC